jgi:hypothetical protein
MPPRCSEYGVAPRMLANSVRVARSCTAGLKRVWTHFCAATFWQRIGLAARLTDAHRCRCLVRAATNRDVRAGPRSGCASPSSSDTTTPPTHSMNNSDSNPHVRHESCTGSYSGRAKRERARLDTIHTQCLLAAACGSTLGGSRGAGCLPIGRLGRTRAGRERVARPAPSPESRLSIMPHRLRLIQGSRNVE